MDHQAKTDEVSTKGCKSVLVRGDLEAVITACGCRSCCPSDVRLAWTKDASIDNLKQRHFLSPGEAYHSSKRIVLRR